MASKDMTNRDQGGRSPGKGNKEAGKKAGRTGGDDYDMNGDMGTPNMRP
jgi:hypothetical protein